jgi:hypothetical protein
MPQLYQGHEKQGMSENCPEMLIKINDMIKKSNLGEILKQRKGIRQKLRKSE